MELSCELVGLDDAGIYLMVVTSNIWHEEIYIHSEKNSLHVEKPTIFLFYGHKGGHTYQFRNIWSQGWS